MPIPILATKLHRPTRRPQVVVRPRLIDKLNEGSDRKLMLISAPAGFGKTTLASEWIAQIGRPVAWLSLDEADSDPARFLTYLVAALQTIEPTVGAQVIAALQSSQPPLGELMLSALLNEITTMPQPFALVLDDYHVLHAEAIDDALTFLIDHAPPQMHLVIITRDEPRLSLPRLRARGQLTEVRGADLRFSRLEAAEFLTGVMRLNLSESDIATLETRTEGWIAGLQLAALSVQAQPDAAAFIATFAGDHPYIVDYLVGEVLERQPDPMRRFLLKTAILQRMTGALCDAVTGQQEGSARLEALERGGFFVVPLDDKREWYRYHHLFAEVLHARLQAQQPDQIAALHRRASAWYEQQGSTADAIHHALEAADFEHAADLVEIAAPDLRQTRQEAALLGWLQALPDAVLHRRPVLSAHYAGGLLLSGQLAGVEARLRDAERWLDPNTDTGERIIVDEVEFRRLAATIGGYRAASALVLGNVGETVKHAQSVLTLADEDDHLRRGAAAGLLGLAYWTSGDLQAAGGAYVEAIARLQTIGHFSDAIGCALALADIRLVQGDLHHALHLYTQMVEMAAARGTPTLRGTADMRVGTANIARERNDLAAAVQHLDEAKALGVLAGLPQNPYRWCVAMARIRQIEGDMDDALELLNRAERLYASDLTPNVRPVAAVRARLWIVMGRFGEAWAWARERGLSMDDELDYLREFERITLARLHLAYEDSPVDVIPFLQRLLAAAEHAGHTGSALEILILLALAHKKAGDTPAALAPLERALVLAAPQGYVRLFVDEAQSMALLLEEAAKRGIQPVYVRQLLAAFGRQGKGLVNDALIDPLSKREMEVLRLLATELDGPDMARELVVSLNTLRTHTKNIYSKLGVNSRRAALRRAEELRLL
jgi:LuxR family transcriptional regulator, maltose regulon positive regulatory protein